MTEQARQPKIYGALIGLMDDIGAIGKDQRNQQQGFQYRGIDDVMNALHPLLCKHKVITIPKVLEDRREQVPGRNGGTLLHSIVKLQITLAAEDGSSIDAVVLGEGMDSGDKATNKALSVAYKYAMFQLLCIPTEEMVAPDRDSPQVVSKPQQPRPVTRPQRATVETVPAQQPAQDAPETKPITCTQCHNVIQATDRMAAMDIAKWTKSKCGATMCAACFKRWNDDQRRYFG